MRRLILLLVAALFALMVAVAPAFAGDKDHEWCEWDCDFDHFGHRSFDVVIVDYDPHPWWLAYWWQPCPFDWDGPVNCFDWWY